MINLDDEDIKKIKGKIKKDEYFEIINSRILKINGKNLQNHLGQDEASERFTREFFVTTKNLDENIKSGKLLGTKEV